MFFRSKVFILVCLSSDTVLYFHEKCFTIWHFFFRLNLTKGENAESVAFFLFKGPKRRETAANSGILDQTAKKREKEILLNKI